MGWHIHTKDGKYNIWSTIIDDYILDGWGSEEEVKKLYIEGRIEEDTKGIKEDAEKLFEMAKKTGFCSVRFANFQCTPKAVAEIQRFHAKQEAETDE